MIGFLWGFVHLLPCAVVKSYGVCDSFNPSSSWSNSAIIVSNFMLYVLAACDIRFILIKWQNHFHISLLIYLTMGVVPTVLVVSSFLTWSHLGFIDGLS
jgi:hypothetical protein